MRCPSQKRLAAASLGADPRAALHAETCELCSAELSAMVEIRAFARRAPVPLASSERRARIAALVMANTDAAEPVRDRWRAPAPMAIIAIAALAAVAALVVWRATPPSPEYAVAWPQLVPHARDVAPAHAIAPAPAPPMAPVPAPEVGPLVAHAAASVAAPAQVTWGAAKPTTRVFAGSQEHRRDGEVARDQVTLEPHAIIARARVVDPSVFEHGWTALREARYADAIAAFDQVVDPAVAEDAAYWAAIAAARAGDRDDATRRLSAFIASFPASERIGEARALLARLAP